MGPARSNPRMKINYMLERPFRLETAGVSDSTMSNYSENEFSADNQQESSRFAGNPQRLYVESI